MWRDWQGSPNAYRSQPLIPHGDWAGLKYLPLHGYPPCGCFAEVSTKTQLQPSQGHLFEVRNLLDMRLATPTGWVVDYEAYQCTHASNRIVEWHVDLNIRRNEILDLSLVNTLA